MIKEKDILIRVSEELKIKLQEKAKSLGLSLSAFIRSTMIDKLSK
jgi:predicted DNA binding CopG/RHH family protein